MKSSLIRLFVASTIAIAAWNVQGATADHLLISEVGMNGSPNSEGEYIEIFNPTTSTVNLRDYWLTDRNEYATLPTDVDGMFTLGGSDNMVRFPVGTTLDSGQVAIIVGKASAFLTTHYGGSLTNYTSQAGNPILFEVSESDGAVENMETHNDFTDPGNPLAPYIWNFTNAAAANGEFIRLFWWDGTADLVKDVDLVVWGFPSGSNAPAQKDSSTVGGNNGATYLQDGGTVTNLTVGDVDLETRVSILEDGEPETGGNGITGHDESLENNAISWIGGTYPADATPGRTSLSVNTGNLPPFINSADRSIQYPGPSDAITLTANATDVDGNVTSVNFFVDSGTGFLPVAGTDAGSDNWTANIGTFADGTAVKYYVEATDDDSSTRTLPPEGAANPRIFVVDDQPIVPGDLVINEVLYNNQGGDAYEWVELYNTRSTPLDLTYVQFADANKSWFSFPPSTTIPANGYVVLTLDVTAFTNIYGSLPVDVQLFDWGTFGLNNTNTNEVLYLLHANGVDFNNVETDLDEVAYVPVAPTDWPILDDSIDQTMELKDPTLDNSLPESWAANTNSVAPFSTPGAPNSVSKVPDWSIY